MVMEYELKKVLEMKISADMRYNTTNFIGHKTQVSLLFTVK